MPYESAGFAEICTDGIFQDQITGGPVRIRSISPIRGTIGGGTLVVMIIDDASASGNSITVDGNAATVISESESEIQFITPAGSEGAVSVAVLTADSRTDSIDPPLGFTYTTVSYPVTPIDALIDKRDNFEIIRDQIALIIATESASQMQLAADAGEDPDLWKLRVYTERSNPWEQLLNEQTDRSPIVNVWYDNSTFDPSSSNIMERQRSGSIFNIDLYGYGKSSEDGTGHIPGDRLAAIESHRAIRLVRNILVAAQNTYLQMRGVVGSRWIDSVTSFQPEVNGRQMQQIVASRIALRVEFNEFSPQVTGTTIDLVSIDIFRAEDGQILIEADYE